MKFCLIAIIGAGPAGMMAALSAAAAGAGGVALFEKNASLGRKLGLTGKGRCNLTNERSCEDFVAAFGATGPFLRQAFSRFFVDDLKSFFQSRGCPLKTERQGRVFPASDASASIVGVLKKALADASVEVFLSAPVNRIHDKDGSKEIVFSDGNRVCASRVVLATGGASYPQTGSTGDGFRMAVKLGHHMEELYPGLVSLVTGEVFVRGLQGLTLKNVCVVFDAGIKKIKTAVGEVLFTHFGVSGPLVLDASAGLCPFLKRGSVKMFIDMKPALGGTALEAKLQGDWRVHGSASIKNYLKTLLPQRLSDCFLKLSGVDAAKKCHQITSAERRKMCAILKAFPLTILKARPLAEAMVTCGGVSLKEVDPKTMESKKIKGLYFCGEVLDLAAASGGYNLQAAFSTGFVAGAAAAASLA